MEGKTSLKLLDCSLRDGGYYTNWDFEKAFVEEYLHRMNRLPVDYIEIGYRSKPKAGYLGAFFYCPDFILKLASEISQKKLAIILNEKDFKTSDLKDLLTPCQGIISLVRIAVAPERLENVLDSLREIRALGFEISLNVMYLSTWKRESSIFQQLPLFDGLLDYLYLVDSYGGMYPEEVEAQIAQVRSQTTVPLGFHAHNNLEMAHINTLVALDAGIEIVDSTILGMGRGAGNLKTELLLTSLQKKGLLEVDFDELSQVVSLFSSLHAKYQWGTNLAYMVSGANSLPQQQVMSRMLKRFYSLNSIVRAVENKSRGLEDNLELLQFDPTETYKAGLIVGGGPSGTLHAAAVHEFLSLNPDICIIHSSSKNAAAYSTIDQQQYHCLIGNEGQRLEKIYGHLEGSEKVAVLPPYPRNMGTYIPSSLKEKAFQLSSFSFGETDKESVTALAIETAIKLKVEKLYFIGYDGYEGNISDAEMELFQENEALFGQLKKQGISFSSLTPTKYNNLSQESVYSYL